MSIEPTKSTKKKRAADPEGDLLDRIFAYMLREMPEIGDRAIAVKLEIRKHVSGSFHYVRQRDATEGTPADDVMRIFNGRNASEVARQLGISRATVYRCLKQPGKR